jgi:ActR/RegA family two-component response regulator
LAGTPAKQSAPQLLLVEPDATVRHVLAQAVEVVRVEPCVDFPAARAKLFATSFDLLVSNLRLGAYNGLHLVHLVRSEPGLPTRCLVYGDRAEWLAREAQRLGAFYEFSVRLPHALPAYLAGC